MPWCPKCKTEYRPEIDICADCGTPLVPGEATMPAIVGAPTSSASGVCAGCLGGLLSWMLLMVLGGISAGSSNESRPALFIWPIICSVMAFITGVALRARFTSSLIGWLLASTPCLALVGLGYAHDYGHTPIAEANLVWCSLLSPLVIGPLAAVAGTRFAKAPKLANLTLWFFPTSATILGLLVASRMMAGSN